MVYCVAQAGLELGILHLQSAEIIGVCYSAKKGNPFSKPNRKEHDAQWLGG